MPAKILIADDASYMRRMMREIVEREYYEVVGEATNGIEAVDMYENLRPDILMMDVIMPKKSGNSATKNILVNNPDAKIIMCSALGCEKLVMDALNLGAREFVVKPYRPEGVLRTIKAVLEQEMPPAPANRERPPAEPAPKEAFMLGAGKLDSIEQDASPSLPQQDVDCYTFSDRYDLGLRERNVYGPLKKKPRL